MLCNNCSGFEPDIFGGALHLADQPLHCLAPPNRLRDGALQQTDHAGPRGLR